MIGAIELQVKKNREFQLFKGHPWIYRDAVRELPTGLAPGTPARVFSHKGLFIGWGLVDPDSQIVIRMIPGPDRISWEALLTKRIHGAGIRRHRFFSDGETDAFRLINGEGDGLPGLIVDRYADTLVLATYTPAWRPWLNLLINVLREDWPGTEAILWRQPTSGKRIQKADFVYGKTAAENCRFRENGLEYRANLVEGQKTGFFLDQRENRSLIRSLSKGAAVANVCGYTGGFSVAAAAGGARSTVTVDSAQPALDEARKNLERNGFPERDHLLACADMYTWLEGHKAGEFDLVILDPPAMARNRQDHRKAMGAYIRLNTLGAGCVRDGGLLFSASCSSQISRDDFLEALREGLFKARRHAVILRETAHAPDHPIALPHPEGRYLKGFLLEVTR